MSARIARGACIAAILFALVLPAAARAQSQCPSSRKSVVTLNTFLGGGGTDEVEGLTTGSQGEVYVTGQTSSSSFPGTTDRPKTGAGMDAFVARFSEDGKKLEWSRVFGGSGTDSGMRVVLGAFPGDLFVVGTTDSSTFLDAAGNPLTHPLTYQGGKDAFLAKLNADTGELLWVAYLGSASDDEGLGLAVSSDARLYVVGKTSSETWNQTTNK